MSAVRERTYLVPPIGTLISKPDLGMILLSIVRKMGYDHPTDDQKKAAKAFVFGKDEFPLLPAGNEMSLCYACFPQVFDEMCRHLGPGSA